MKLVFLLVVLVPLVFAGTNTNQTSATTAEPTETANAVLEKSDQIDETPRRQFVGHPFSGYGRGFDGRAHMGGFAGYPQAGFHHQTAHRGTVTTTHTQTSIYQATSYYSCGQRWYTNGGVICPPTFFPPRTAAIITSPSKNCGAVAVGGQYGYTGPEVGSLGPVAYVPRPVAVAQPSLAMYQSSSYYYCGNRCYTAVGVICPPTFVPPPTAVIVSSPNTCGRPIAVAQPRVAVATMYQSSSYYYCGNRCYTAVGVVCPPTFVPPPTAVIVSSPNRCGSPLAVARPQLAVSAPQMSVSTMYQSTSYYYCGNRCYTAVGVVCPPTFVPPPTAVIVSSPNTCGRPIAVAGPRPYPVPAYGSAVNAFPSIYQASSYYYCGQRCYTVRGVLCPQSFLPPPTAVIVAPPMNACGSGPAQVYGVYGGSGGYGRFGGYQQRYGGFEGYPYGKNAAKQL